jgi:hypothetical protein
VEQHSFDHVVIILIKPDFTCCLIPGSNVSTAAAQRYRYLRYYLETTTIDLLEEGASWSKNVPVDVPGLPDRLYDEV